MKKKGNNDIMAERLYVDKNELKERINKNYDRLLEPYYQIEQVFADKSYDWPGDKEGRALLAFVSHYKINKRINPCMDKMIEQIKDKTDGRLFFGEPTQEIIDEQQLSGHSWYLRGLLEYYKETGDEFLLTIAKETVKGLYLPLLGRLSTYPIEREAATDGDVSGHADLIINNWKLSTDIGCAFMCIDGLSQYFEVTKDEKVKAIIDEMIDILGKIDQIKIQAQTHCMLTAGRGFVRMYHLTSNEKYLLEAKKILRLYIQYGMTYTYQNFNWWGKGDTWTEPCAIVDSLMLALDVYKITGEEEYRTLAARIWHNGFSAMQVGNGGAGTTTTVSDTMHYLSTKMYEAYFCCTMRLAEGLWYVDVNKDLLYAELDTLKKDEKGRYMNGDILYAEISASNKELFLTENVKEIDSMQLIPLIKYYKYPKEITDSIIQKVIFD